MTRTAVTAANHCCPDPTRHRLRSPSRRTAARRAGRVGVAVGRRLGPLAARRILRRTGSSTDTAHALRAVCDDAGATFTKLGQLVASSPTLFGEDLASAFRSCLDRGAAVAFEDVVAEIELGLGGPIDDQFAHIDPAPIGQASLAVVHRARLVDGREVAVKVLRPGIEEIVAADLALLRPLLGTLTRLAAPGLVDLVLETIDGLRAQLEEELDLRNEAAVMAYFRSLPEGARLPLVVVPEPILALTSRRVLVMELLDGVAIDDVDAAAHLGIDPAPLVEQTVKAWLLCALRGGIFHGDVHAGNILLLRDGRVGVIDWGIVGRLSDESHWLLRRFIGGAALGDEAAWDELATHLEAQLADAGIPDVDRDTVRMLLREQLGAVVNQPFGSVSLSGLLLALQGGPERVQPQGSRWRRARALRSPSAVMDRGMLLLAKQLAYFERYGRMYLGDIAVLRDEAFFREALAAGPLDQTP